MLKWFRRDKREARAVDGYTEMALLARAEAISGAGAELSGIVAGCVSLWANGLAMADTDAEIFTPEVLASIGRELATVGNSVWYIGPDGLVPVFEWDVTTEQGRPRAYRLSVPDIRGPQQVHALAGEVLHFRVGADVRAPWRGVAPLQRAQLSAGLLNATESALAEVFRDAPLGSQVLAMPETTAEAKASLAASFRGRRGRVLVRDSSTTYSGSQGQPDDWRPAGLTPNLRDSMALESLRTARETVLHVFGILPCLLNEETAGPAVREAQRHLATWTLGPIARAIVHEVRHKTGEAIRLDPAAGLHAFDVGGHARALGAIVGALAEAKAAGLDAAQVLDAARIAGVRLDA